MHNYRIYGTFKTLSPLSHIGETISTTTYLLEEPILQEDGSIEPVFVYNGNAWRGQLRDFAALYYLDALKVTVGLDAFHLLFSGGKIGGDQSIDIQQARRIRQAVPLISLFGGGVGNQILPGKMRVGSSYPVCKETASILSRDGNDFSVSYRQMTTEKSFTRTDDGKSPRKAQLVKEKDRIDMFEAIKKEGEASTQMRMTSELLIAGVTLEHQIDLLEVSAEEIGVLVSALCCFDKSPYIGGQATRGHGKVDYTSYIINTDTGERYDFVRVSPDRDIRLSDFALDAKKAYDEKIERQRSGVDSVSDELGAEPCDLA